jgi:hypothetical protein
MYVGGQNNTVLIDNLSHKCNLLLSRSDYPYLSSVGKGHLVFAAHAGYLATI